MSDSISARTLARSGAEAAMDKAFIGAALVVSDVEGLDHGTGLDQCTDLIEVGLNSQSGSPAASQPCPEGALASGTRRSTRQNPASLAARRFRSAAETP